MRLRYRQPSSRTAFSITGFGVAAVCLTNGSMSAPACGRTMTARCAASASSASSVAVASNAARSAATRSAGTPGGSQ